MSGAGQAFTYRVIAPPVWALIAVATIELIVTHLVVAHWTFWGAVILPTLSVAVIGWIAVGALSMRSLPVLVHGDAIVMRAGRLKAAVIPIAQVRGLRREWSADELKRPTVLNCALLSCPNVMIELTAPLPGRRGVTAVAHRLDDPAGFAVAVDAAQMRHSQLTLDIMSS